MMGVFKGMMADSGAARIILDPGPYEARVAGIWAGLRPPYGGQGQSTPALRMMLEVEVEGGTARLYSTLNLPRLGYAPGGGFGFLYHERSSFWRALGQITGMKGPQLVGALEVDIAGVDHPDQLQGLPELGPGVDAPQIDVRISGRPLLGATVGVVVAREEGLNGPRNVIQSFFPVQGQVQRVQAVAEEDIW